MQIPEDSTTDNTHRNSTDIRKDVRRTLDTLRDAVGDQVPAYFCPMISNYVKQGVIPESHLQTLSELFDKTEQKFDQAKFFVDLLAVCNVIHVNAPSTSRKI